MTAAPAQLARERGDLRFVHQSMYYPATDDAMDTGSYEQFAESYVPTAKAMAWPWKARNLLGRKGTSPSETRRHPTWRATVSQPHERAIHFRPPRWLAWPRGW
jgi:acetyl esterase/lipase